MENKDQIKEVQIDKINSSYKNENFQDDITSSKQKSLSSKQSPPLVFHSKQDQNTSIKSK